MGLKKTLLFLITLGIVVSAWATALSSTALAAKCEIDRPIIFAGLDWDSNAFHTELASYILATGYGCEVDQIPGSTLPLFNGMGRGDIDITMEMWKDNLIESWMKLESEGKVVQVGINFPDAIQGWFVPRYMLEGDKKRGIKATTPGLKHVKDLPKYKKLLSDPEEPSKGRFYNCILGWACEKVNSKKLLAYGLDKHYTNFRPGTGAALAAAIASNYKKGKPFVAYYWGPTWVMGKYDMVMLEEPPYNKTDWDKMATEENPKIAVAYPVVPVYVAVNGKFHKEAPTIVKFLGNYRTTNKMVSEALSFMQEKKGRTAKDAAMNFLKTQEKVWTKWVPADVARQVKASL